MIFRVTLADMQWPCDGRSLFPMSSVLSAFSLFAHRLLILPHCFLFSPIFCCCNRRPQTRSLMRKVVYFVYSLQAKMSTHRAPAVSAHGGKAEGQENVWGKVTTQGQLDFITTALHPTHVTLQSADCLPASRAFSLCPNPSSNTPHWWSDFSMSFARINHTQTLATPVLWLPDSPPITEWHRKCFDPW